MNDGKLPWEYLENVQKEEVDDNPKEVERLRRRADELMTWIERVTKDLDVIKFDKHGIHGERLI